MLRPLIATTLIPAHPVTAEMAPQIIALYAALYHQACMPGPFSR